MTLKQEDLERADKAWQEWLTFIDQHRAFDQTVKGKDGWTLPEAMAHISRWQEWAVERIQHFLNLGEHDTVLFDEMNARWALDDAGVSFASAFQRNSESAMKLRAKIESVPDERWNQELHEVLEGNTWEHYAEHMGWH